MSKKIIPVDWQGKDDDNNGYIYGVEYIDDDGNTVDVEWFKHKKERDESL
jgi:hypothetical protein